MTDAGDAAREVDRLLHEVKTFRRLRRGLTISTGG
jgi:hypothetical protein